ncbi:DinB family protein [Peribacillus muralis]|nr:DinB family protein [Peribacillus muralis]
MGAWEMIEAYKSDVQNYSIEQLQYISAKGVWSICQMYDHLIAVAHEYLDNVELCAKAEEEQSLGKTEFGKQLYQNGGFPPIKIKLPDEMNAPPNNQDSMEKLTTRLDHVMNRLQEWKMKVGAINPNLKVKHGGFGWLNAQEWYELVGMHFRHHLRQKAELELNIENGKKETIQDIHIGDG